MSKKGFTLIELLVVMAIISLLSSIVLATVRDARQKAYETQLVQTVKQIQNGLELYKTEYGYYPYGFFEVLHFSNQNITPPTYSQDFSLDSNESNISRFINFEQSTSNIKDSTRIYYLSSRYGLEQFGGEVITCDLEATDQATEGNKEKYAIVVEYPGVSNRLGEQKPAQIFINGEKQVFEGYLETPNACFSIE